MIDPRIERFLADETLGAGNFLFRYYDALGDDTGFAIHCDRPIRVGNRDLGVHIKLAGVISAARRLAGWYRAAGIQAKDPVGVFIDDGPEYYLHYLALTRIGAIPAFVNPNMAVATAADYLRRVRVVAVAADAKRLAGMGSSLSNEFKVFDVAHIDLERATDVDKPFAHHLSDPVLIAHSSGTTGYPKAVQFNHFGLAFGAKQQLKHSFGDRSLTVLPHAHAAAIVMLISCALRGIPLLAPEQCDATKVLRMIAEFKPHIVLGFAKVFVDLCRHDLDQHDLRSVRMWLATGDASHERHIRKLVRQGSQAEGERPGSLFCDNLGTSELAFGVLRNIHTSKSDLYGRCLGRAFEWAEVEVFDQHGQPTAPYQVGQLGVKAPSVTAGYWNDSVATERSRLNGYWLTGDLVYRNEAGLFYHVDRTPDKILTAGKDVYCLQTEELIMKHFEEFFDCNVVADGRNGLVLTGELEDPTVDRKALEGRVNEFLQSAQLPQISKLIVVDEGWNEGVTGKKLRRVIRDKVQELATDP